MEHFRICTIPIQTQVPGLSDSSSTGWIGLLLAAILEDELRGSGLPVSKSPVVSDVGVENETQTHAVLVFYTFYPTPRLSVSFFGGPQHSDTPQPVAVAGSDGMDARRGRQSELAGALEQLSLSATRTSSSSGGGLVGAVQMDSATSQFGNKSPKL